MKPSDSLLPGNYCHFIDIFAESNSVTSPNHEPVAYIKIIIGETSRYAIYTVLLLSSEDLLPPFEIMLVKHSSLPNKHIQSSLH